MYFKFVDGALLTFLFAGLNPYLKSNKENITLRHKTTFAFTGKVIQCVSSI